MHVKLIGIVSKCPFLFCYNNTILETSYQYACDSSMQSVK